MLTDPAYFGRNWCDIMAEQEQANETKLLRMSAAEWKEEGKRIIRTWTGDLRKCIAYLNMMDEKRAAFGRPQAAALTAGVRRHRTEFDIDFAIWRDMVENPSAYGDDIVEWLELDEKLTRGPGRWRLGAFWDRRQAEEDEKEALRKEAEEFMREVRAATVIAAAVRGHQARTKQVFRDCCMCLSHRISPLQTDVGMMCRGCAEQGPYTDETGPLADPWEWFRADYVDLAPVAEDFDGMCRYCESLPAAWQEEFCDDICRQYYEDEKEFGPNFKPPPPRVPGRYQCKCCFSQLDPDTVDFCDRDCEYEYMKEAWRESRY